MLGAGVPSLTRQLAGAAALLAELEALRAPVAATLQPACTVAGGGPPRLRERPGRRRDPERGEPPDGQHRARRPRDPAGAPGHALAPPRGARCGAPTRAGTRRERRRRRGGRERQHRGPRVRARVRRRAVPRRGGHGGARTFSTRPWRTRTATQRTTSTRRSTPPTAGSAVAPWVLRAVSAAAVVPKPSAARRGACLRRRGAVGHRRRAGLANAEAARSLAQASNAGRVTTRSVPHRRRRRGHPPRRENRGPAHPWRPMADVLSPDAFARDGNGGITLRAVAGVLPEIGGGCPAFGLTAAAPELAEVIRAAEAMTGERRALRRRHAALRPRDGWRDPRRGLLPGGQSARGPNERSQGARDALREHGCLCGSRASLGAREAPPSVGAASAAADLPQTPTRRSGPNPVPSDPRGAPRDPARRARRPAPGAGGGRLPKHTSGPREAFSTHRPHSWAPSAGASSRGAFPSATAPPGPLMATISRGSSSRPTGPPSWWDRGGRRVQAAHGPHRGGVFAGGLGP